MKKQALFYEALSDSGTVQCHLCPHRCVIKEGYFGKCRVRQNEAGSLYTINYGQVVSLALDPIRKKPLKFYRPGTNILSAGSFGCNLTCDFCQNHSISQDLPASMYMASDQLALLAEQTGDNIGIAFTYNEPTIWYEYVYDCARLIKEKNKDTSVVLITNGYINREPLIGLLPFVDAMNIDLKSFSDDYYKRLCGGSLQPVLDTIEVAAARCHVEITTLLVTGENDSLEEVGEVARFIAAIDPDIPLHLSRYFPNYKLENPPTDTGFIVKARDLAGKYLNHVLTGNM
ncbi:MAG TPA: AmmeMemoRadiSam system radical SAM enzyme [Bacillota bacterium]|nr:AmmeMemoRadiSam system radical SAM enzyme [Bacillota bacterium]